VSATLEFFDCNARIGRPTVGREGEITTPEELLAEMDRAHIARALVHHVLAVQWSPVDGNAILAETLAAYDRLLPCFVGLPSATGELPPPAEFAAQVRAAHGAVRFFPKENQFRFTPWCLDPLLTELEAVGVPVLLEIAQTDWNDIANVLAAHPRLHVILTGTYYRMDRYLYPLWERFENLHVELTTYQVFAGLEKVCKLFGPERLVFGAELSRLEPGGAVAMVTYADISDDAKAAIAGGTLSRMLGLG
jgi:predicted TIM-barrel fold metal-dependent hydrolase